MKGQIWSIDFAASIVIFISVIVVMMFVWTYTSSQVAEQKSGDDIQSLAISVSDSLVRTPGFPPDWNNETVSVIGLADEENILNETKVEYFLYMGKNDYDRVRSLLGISYNFHFNLTHLNNTMINETGIEPLNADIIVPIERYCVYLGKPVKVRFIIWK
jgi:hypothetical protein